MTAHTRPEWTRIGWPIGVSALSITLLLWLSLSEVYPLLSTLGASGSGDNLDEPLRKPLQEHDELMQRSIDRFIGRSLFDRVPSDWPRPAPVPRVAPVVVKTEPPPPPAPPPPQRIYGGPKPLAIIGDSVIFDGSTAPIQVGETFGEIRVLRVVLPYSVVVLWDRGEHTVPLFASDETLWRSAAPAEDVFQSPAWTAPASRVNDPQWGDGSFNRSLTATLPNSRGNTPPAASPRPESNEPPSASAASQPAAVDDPMPAEAPQGVPTSLTAGQIEGMSRTQVIVALARIVAARTQPNIDPDTAQRLQHELEMLRARQGALSDTDRGPKPQ